MAFGARELRLILSIQSYGTGNLARLRRDITQLERAAGAANANQLATAERASRMQSRIAATQRRIASLERRTFTARGTNQLARREKLLKAANAAGARGIVLEKALTGQYTLKNRQAQAIVNSIRAMDAAENMITTDLKTQNVLLGEQQAELKGILGLDLARAKTLDAQIARLTTLQAKELKLRTLAHGFRTAQFGGLVGLASVVGAGNAFANFNKQLVLAATQARAVDAPLSDVAKQAEFIAQGMDKGGRHIKGIMDLMQEFPATGDDMAAAAYDIFSSMDVTTEGGLKLLRTFNQLAVATGSDLATAVDSGITVLNNFGAASGNVNDQMNLMMTIIRFGRMRLEDLNAMLEKVAPAATASGMALEDVAGAMIAITRLQPSQRVGATGIARLLQTFRDPDFQRGAAKFGADITIGADAVGRLKPLPQIIKQFAESFGLFERFGGPGQLFQSLTATGRGRGIGRASRIEAQNAFTFLVGHVDQYLALQKRATSETQEFAVALKAMSESPGVRWEIFINQMRAFVLTVGESVLPALLNIADKVAVAIKWFDGLNKSTRGALGAFLTYGSVVALLVGTLGNLVFSLLAAITNMKIMRLSSQLMASDLANAQTQASRLSISMQTLAGIGIISIPIIMQIIKGGDPGLWDFLSAAGFGAAGGAMIGAPFGPPGMAVGAAVGALTVPVVLQVTSMFQDGENSPRSAAEKAYKEYRDTFTGFSHRFADGKKISGKPLGFEEWLSKHPKLLRQHKKFLKENMSDEESILEQYRKNSNAFMKEQIDKWTKHSQDLENAYKKQNSVAEKEAQRALQIEKARTNAIQQATEARTEKIEQMTDKILQIYDQFEEQNRQALGAFAQGPVMQGILGNVFGGINDLLRQFGVQIPIPFQILRRDMDMQLSYFRRWRTALDNLIKRGAPLGLVQEIQSMGIAQGLPVAEGLLAGGKAGWRSLIKVWRQGQDALQRATKTDTDAQLREWEKYGKDIAFAILRGLADEPTQAALRAGYQKYITSTFGSILQAEFANEVATAMAQAIEDIEAATAAAGTPTAGRSKGTTAGTSGKTRTDPLGRFLRQAETARRRFLQSRAPLRLAVDAAVNPLGPGGQLIVPAEQAAINRAQAQRAQAQRAFQRARSGAVGLIQGQISRQERRHPNAPRYAITYNNETFYFNSNMTAQQIYRAIQAKRRKRRKKQTKN